jgi:hypothetical protein
MTKETDEMLTKVSLKQRARSNMSATIDKHSRFPKRVYVGDWRTFFFFDSDWVFDMKFVDKIRQLLDIESGKCAVIVNLDEDVDAENSFFSFENETTHLDFQLFLNGTDLGGGWLHSVGRFGCVSDVGEWSIYCEKGSEIAVIAVRGNIRRDKYSQVVAAFKALPIDQAISMPLSYGFSERALSFEWRQELCIQFQNS